ncbi:MAG: SufE family protein [Gammaproteobacteria bacterium]|nr:SufE family protein [Gammaproteobacteria bacterium]NND53373.1 SufE family protein [Gammaproteobacteria bacterium]
MTTIAAAQEELIEEFQLFDNWLDKYQYLIDLGRKLPAFPDDYKTEEYRLHGCQSQVWLRADGNRAQLEFSAISDSAIVSGLIAVLMRVYSGRSAEEILNTPPDFIDAIGLDAHLSPTRSNGLHAMIDAIKGHAAQCVG